MFKIAKWFQKIKIMVIKPIQTKKKVMKNQKQPLVLKTMLKVKNRFEFESYLYHK